MITFLNFIEALKVNDANLKHLQNHPLTQSSKFGVEIEIITADIPDKDFSPLLLYYGLLDTELHKEADMEFEEGMSDKDFMNYINDNQKKALEAYREQIKKYESNDNDSFLNGIIRYWSKKFMKAIEGSGYEILPGKQSHGKIWAIGDDGRDQEFGLPLMEIRTGIISYDPQNINQFKNALKAIKNVFLENQKYLMVTGSTGIHIHVSNPMTNDYFTRLSAISHVDEDHIWNSQVKYDRNFERYANLNKGQDFYNQKGAHDEIYNVFQKYKGKIIPKNEFEKLVKHIGRNNGVNVTSEHPTVEYRYFTSALLMEGDGEDKIIKYIDYLVKNTAAHSNKSQIKIKNSYDDVLIFARQINNDVMVSMNKNPKRVDSKTQDLIKSKSQPDLKSRYGTLPFSIKKQIMDKIK